MPKNLFIHIGIAILFLIVLIVLTIILYKDIPWGLFFGPSQPASQNPAYNIKLRGFSYDIADITQKYAILEKNNVFYIVDSNNSLKNITDLYPTFHGKPIDMVVNKGEIYIFSDNGMVYNPLNYSQLISQNWMHLPYLPQFLIGVDATESVNGKIFGYDKSLQSGLNFIFYYSTGSNNITYIDTDCTPGTTPNYCTPGTTYCTSNSNQPNFSCTYTQGTFIVPKLGGKINAISHTQEGTLYFVSDGNIYNQYGVMPEPWYPSYQNVNYPTTLLKATKSISFANTDTEARFQLMGVDNQETVPYFIVNQSGIYYIVTPGNAKLPLTTVYPASQFPFVTGYIGNLIDMTKLSTDEYDYLLLVVSDDYYFINKYFPNQGVIRLSDIEKQYIYPNGRPSAPKGLTHILSFLKGNKLVIFYENGDWFSLLYTRNNDKSNFQITGLDLEYSYRSSGGNDVNPNQIPWNQWDNIKNAVSQFGSLQNLYQKLLGVSSYNWTFYFRSIDEDKGDTIDGSSFAFDQQPQQWKVNIQNSGLGSWQNISFDEWQNVNGQATYVGTGQNYQYPSDLLNTIQQTFTMFPNFSITSGKGKIIGTFYAITFENAWSQVQKNSACVSFEYDRIMKKLVLYSFCYENTEIHDFDSDLFVLTSWLPTFTNRFCVQHKPSGKFLYWDFSPSTGNPDDMKLGLTDSCIYTQALPPVSTDPNSDYQKQLAIAKQSLGGLWSFSSTLDDTNPSNGVCLQNLNPSLSGNSSLQNDLKLHTDCGTETWNFANGTISYNNQCITSDGTNISMGNCNRGEWVIYQIPCPTPCVGDNPPSGCVPMCCLGTSDNPNSNDPPNCVDPSTGQNCIGPIFSSFCP